MKQRDTYVDIAKGICMLLIVCIHTEVFGVIGMPLTFIAVPMFFFMSGFYDRSENPIRKWLPKALKTLIIPAIVWVIIGTIYSQLLQFIKGGVISYSFNIFNPCEGNGPAWFLFALLYVKLLVWIFKQDGMPQVVVFLLTLCLGYLGSAFQMPLLLDEGFAAFPLYFIGKCAYPKIKKMCQNYRLIVFGVIGLILFLTHIVSYTIVPIDNGCFKPFYIIALTLIVAVFFPMLYLSLKLEKMQLLSKFGRNSLGIMLLHSPMCHTAAVILNRVFEKDSSSWIIAFLCAYVVIIMLSYILTLAVNRFFPVLLGK